MTSGKKIYFASDMHLGAPNWADSLVREKKLVSWLDTIKLDAEAIYLVGDIFDFWFEYKHVVPRGYVRLLGKLAELTDSGIPIHVFTGNHDMWIFDYLPKETGVIMHREPIDVKFGNHLFHIAHGDGLGPGDRGYKFLKKVFASKVCQWLFARFHPNFGIGLANFWSRRSRSHTKKKDEFHGEDKEWLVIYSKEKLNEQPYDFFIYGHRHLPLEIDIEGKAKYVNLGDWIEYFTYGEYDGQSLTLKKLD